MTLLLIVLACVAALLIGYGAIVAAGRTEDEFDRLRAWDDADDDDLWP